MLLIISGGFYGGEKDRKEFVGFLMKGGGCAFGVEDVFFGNEF